MRRFLRLALVGLGLVGIVAVVSAQAAGNTKPYVAKVRVESAATPNTFRMSLTNDPKAQQALGSANFTLPPNFSAPQGPLPSADISSTNFNVTVVGNVVQFRATSSSTSLAAGATVYADVTVTIPASPNCTTGAWTVQAKQSNDFSGAPGNFMSLSPASDLTPLGSFVWTPIQSLVPDPPNPDVPVPQIIVGVPKQLGVTAEDTCGIPDPDYSGATLAPLAADPLRLVNATLTGLSWSGGSGSATLTPKDVEVQDNLLVSDPTTGIAQPSNTFDVVEKICAISGTTCQWSNKKGTITATSTVGTSTVGDTASLGLGFRSGSGVCTVAGQAKSPIGDGIQIVPLNYSADGTYTVTLTYSKSISPSGPASGFNVCKNSDPNGTGTWTPIAQCGKVPVAPCAAPTKTPGGAIQVTLYLEPGDPFTNGFG